MRIVKTSTIITVEFLPMFKRIWITRRLKNGINLSRQYPLHSRSLTRIFKVAGHWRWVQPHVSTPRLERK
jgi:hypothetical protein